MEQVLRDERTRWAMSASATASHWAGRDFILPRPRDYSLGILVLVIRSFSRRACLRTIPDRGLVPSHRT
eukprot:3558431-Alexandrium_andersonii.AAC.1